MKSICTITGCNRFQHGQGYCKLHYYRLVFYRQPVQYLRRLFHNRYYYRMPGVKQRSLERSRSPKNKAFHRTYQKRAARRNPRIFIGLKASEAVRTEIRAGRMTRQPCEVCGAKAQAHHDSYLPENWLKVRWLCSAHHGEWHRANEPEYPSFD